MNIWTMCHKLILHKLILFIKKSTSLCCKLKRTSKLKTSDYASIIALPAKPLAFLFKSIRLHFLLLNSIKSLLKIF